MIVFLILGIVALILLFVVLVTRKKKKEQPKLPPYTIPDKTNPDWPNADGKLFFVPTDHHTLQYKFEDATIVARRGFPIVLMFKDVPAATIQQLRKQPPKLSVDDITVTIDHVADTYMVLSTPVTSPIGEGTLQLGPYEFQLYLIFNPYHKEDAVYMDMKTADGKDVRDEYIQNTLGFVFYSSRRGNVWSYDQFNPEVLQVIMKLIKDPRIREQIDPEIEEIDLSSPVQVSRLCTALIAQYLLTGNWSKQGVMHPEVYMSEGKPLKCDVEKDLTKWPNYSSTCTPDTTGNFAQCLPASLCGIAGTATKANGDQVPLTPLINGRLCTPTRRYSDEPIKSECDKLSWKNYKKWQKGKYKDQKLSGKLKDGSPYEYDHKVTCLTYNSNVPTVCARGATPGSWKNSGSIYRLWKYMNIDYSSEGDDPAEWGRAKYGQCWVFGAVLNTAMRALGIPCRQITTLDSAHPGCDTLALFGRGDCNDTMANFDGAMYAYGKGGKEYVNGSIWNFHSWNDAWMRRDDLKQIAPQYSALGWQAIDATFQEESYGVSQCGPAPLAAIKAVDFNNNTILYDVNFVSTEVNHKIVPASAELLELAGISPKLVTKTLQKRPGQPITTKILLPTDIYKGETDYTSDDICEELWPVYCPAKPANALQAFLRSVEPNVFIQATSDKFGNPVVIQGFFFSNVSGAVTFTVNAVPTDYTTKVLGPSILSFTERVSVVADQTFEYRHEIQSEAFPVRTTQYFQLTLDAQYPDGTHHVDVANVYIPLPTIKVDIQSCCAIRKGERKDVRFTFANTSAVPLTNVEFSASSADLQLGLSQTIPVIEPGRIVTWTGILNGSKLHYAQTVALVTASLTCTEFGEASAIGSQALSIIHS
jgi:hypothetical protein